VGPIAFTPWFHAVVSGRYLWLGDSGSDSLVRIGPTIAERHHFRLPIPRRAPPPALIAAERAEEGAGARDERSRSWVNAKYSPKYLPQALPYFGALIPGLEGEVWVSEYAGTRSPTTRYLVIGPSGEVRAWVHAQAGFRIKEIGRDYVTGVHYDADGVETVRIYGLTRR
jgi:hypothetical protein